jgi:hypothetical protein
MSMAALLSQNMESLVTGTLSSSRAFVSQIHYVVVSARAIYSDSHVEVATDFYFMERQQIVKLLSQKSYRKCFAECPDNFHSQSWSILPE